MKHEYKNLRIWHLAREVNKLTYSITTNFPNVEKYALIGQMRRASISIVSNISEGSSYQSNKMFKKFLDIALGSLCELETQVYLGIDVQYLKEQDSTHIFEKCDYLKRMIISFKNKLN